MASEWYLGVNFESMVRSVSHTGARGQCVSTRAIEICQQIASLTIRNTYLAIGRNRCSRPNISVVVVCCT